jgi:hypothetical protein
VAIAALLLPCVRDDRSLSLSLVILICPDWLAGSLVIGWLACHRVG